MNNLSFFGSINYGGAQTSDIFHNYDKFFKNIEEKYIFKEYSIRNAPRPELLSYMLYGTVEYYWVLLLINDIYDPFYDWVMTEQSVHEYTNQKYQYVGGADSVAYHENRDGEQFWNVAEDPAHPNMWYDKMDVLKAYLQYNGPLVPISNIEHELRLNENRRVIRIVQPSDIKNFVSDMRREMETAYGRTKR